MGFLMDAIAERADDHASITKAMFRDELERIAPICQWTEGEWQFGEESKKWNEIQNLAKDIESLASCLLKEYLYRIKN